jgi:lambda family phage minor tail protein L
MTIPAEIAAEIQKLEPSAIIELFVLDGTAIDAPILYFHAGTNKLCQPLVWQGVTYTPWPIIAEGLEITSSGQQPRPKFTLANANGAISLLAVEYGDLRGAKLILKRTLAKYLDAVNFPGGVNATADPTLFFDDIFYKVDQKDNEDSQSVSFSVASPGDLTGVLLPARQIIQNVCGWRYRGADCGYAGTSYFTDSDVATTDPAQDLCGKRLKSCTCRFPNGDLPYGGFPAAGLIKTS